MRLVAVETVLMVVYAPFSAPTMFAGLTQFTVPPSATVVWLPTYDDATAYLQFT